MSSKPLKSQGKGQNKTKGSKISKLEQGFVATASPNRHRLAQSTYEVDYSPKAVEIPEPAKKIAAPAPKNRLLST